MGLFGKNKVIDLSEGYKQQREHTVRVKKDASRVSDESAVTSGFGFLGSIANSVSESSKQTESDDLSDSSEEKRKKLAKRLVDMTSKIEELSNQIYHLQQRVEVLEKKKNVSY